jgi:Reverse transcriptase (RNA-dependent DNA polymerase)
LDITKISPFVPRFAYTPEIVERIEYLFTDKCTAMQSISLVIMTPALHFKTHLLNTMMVYSHKNYIVVNQPGVMYSRWNLDGSKQVHGMDFDNIYSPTVTWPSIRLVLTLVAIHSWKTRQLNFVQAFPQVKISHQQFVGLPKEIQIEGVDPEEWVFKALQNVYGGKDAGRQ